MVDLASRGGVEEGGRREEAGKYSPRLLGEQAVAEHDDRPSLPTYSLVVI